jgi:hypothetical protein
MIESRRRWLSTSAFALGALAAAHFISAQVAPRPLPSPNAPDQGFPPGLNGPRNNPEDGNRRADPQLEKEIRSDVEKLFDLALDLKQQVQKSDSTSTLSLNVVKTAQQIEKLAKQIKNLSRG